MIRNIISGIIFSEFNDIIGPESVAHLPPELNQTILGKIASVTIDFFLNECDNSETLLIIPFPILNKKGLVRYLIWPDDRKRGGKAQGSLTLLFEEEDDPIFYKYLKDFEGPFELAANKIIELRKKDSSRESIYSELEGFYSEIVRVLEDLSEHELPMKAQLEEFPESSDQLREKIKYKFKIIIIGDPMVGKTSTVLRYSDRAFTRSYLPTLGVNMSQKTIRHKNSLVQLVLWDLAGQIKYRNCRYHFYQGANAAIMVYDLTNRSSFENIPKWYQDVTSHVKDPEQLQVILCGNKKDLRENVQVSTQEGMKLARTYNIHYFETSALAGENISEAFTILIDTLIALASSAVLTPEIME